MRSSVISVGLETLQPNEEVTAKRIVQWIIEALEVTANLPDFTINPAGQVSRALFNHLHSETRKVVFDFGNLSYAKEMDRMVDAVGRIFDATVEWNSTNCWIQVGRFLNDLTMHCTNGLFVVVSAAIGSMLLNKMIAVPGFDANNDIIDSMLLYYKCGSAVVKELHKKRKTKLCIHLRAQYMNGCDAYLGLIGNHLIFSSDAFFELTTEILLGGIKRCVDDATIRKYLDAVYFPLDSNDQAAKTNMAMFVRRLDVKENLLYLMRVEKSTYAQKMILKILKAMLQYSRDTNVPFDIDWPTVFAYTVYWHSDALDLLILEAEGTEDDSEIRAYNVIERIVQVYLRYNDLVDQLPAKLLEQERIHRFTNLMKGHVDFVTCDRLFYLLRKHVTTSPAMCAVIILLIDNAAKTMVDQTHFQADYLRLVKIAFRHIQYVKPYPELLCRLINIFNLTVAKNDEHFSQEIMSSVPEAFYKCDSYGTAIALLEKLKVMGYDDDKLVGLFEKLVENESSGNRTKETLTLFLAADEVFDIFTVLNPDNRRSVFSYFMRKFDAASDDEKILYAALVMHMLAAFHSTPERFPGKAFDTTEQRARFVHQILSEAIDTAEELSSASVHLGIAICVYHATFDLVPAGTPLLVSLSHLVKSSIEFRFNYQLDATKNAALNDLRLLTKFWHSANSTFKDRVVPDGVIPSVIFECYPRIEIHLVPLAEAFLTTILRYGSRAEQHNLFALSTMFLVMDVKRQKINPIVNKLFTFIEKTVNPDHAKLIATKIFMRNVDALCENTSRHKLVAEVQKNLYNNHMKNDTDFYQNAAMNVLNAQIDFHKGGTRQILVELRKCLQPSGVPEQENDRNDNEGENDGNEEEQEEMDVDIIPDRDQSNRDSMSLGGINHSIIRPIS